MSEMYNVNNQELSISAPPYLEYYRVNERGSLYAIAKDTNINPQLLSILNGLDIDSELTKNQMLLLPKTDYAFYITKEGDTLETVSHTLALDTQEIVDNNPTIYLHSGQLIAGKVK